MGVAVGKNECVGRPGVGGAHVQRVGRFGADLPGGGEEPVMVGEAFVEDIVKNNSPQVLAAAPRP